MSREKRLFDLIYVPGGGTLRVVGRNKDGTKRYGVVNQSLIKSDGQGTKPNPWVRGRN